LLKGGHLKSATATDLLVSRDGVEEFSAPYRQGIDAHGTGCTYAAAIATGLAQGMNLSEAVRRAKRYISAAINGSLRWGGTTALDHRVWP
jgi:hydroxymethylpyrimidine/phosphomethylpyrimidine kinase